MSKDLFEQQIGETLRKAESTPPAGAWELIKSQIPTQNTPPFKFPSWAVVAVSAVLLGGMALSDQNFESEISENRIAQISAVVTQNKQTGAAKAYSGEEESISIESGVANGLTTPEQSAGGVVEMEGTTLNEGELISVDKSGSEENIINQSGQAEQPKSQATLPVQVQAAYPLQALVEQSNTEESESDFKEESRTTSTQVFEPSLSIEGAKTCYTPCELALNAIGNATEFSWDAASFGLIQGKKLNLTIDEPQSLTVYAIARYKDGSERSLPRTIEVKAGSELFVPNSFTPNGDGVNDTYLVGGTGIESFSLTIVNSKGKVVFQTSNIKEAWSFDGSSNELENEVYTAIIRATGIDGKAHTENQRLTILP